MNGGTCQSNGFGGFTCQCTPGYTGQRCEDRTFSLSVSTNHFPPSHLFIQGSDPCASQPCMNQGTCMRDNGGFRCVCPPGYTGQRCEIRDACQSNPCMNGGTCQTVNGNGYQCICPSGYTGPRCENRKMSVSVR